jgi:hypothetical protein
MVSVFVIHEFISLWVWVCRNEQFLIYFMYERYVVLGDLEDEQSEDILRHSHISNIPPLLGLPPAIERIRTPTAWFVLPLQPGLLSSDHQKPRLD